MSNPVFGYQGMNDIAVQRYKNFLIKNKIPKKFFFKGICEPVDYYHQRPLLSSDNFITQPKNLNNYGKK